MLIDKNGIRAELTPEKNVLEVRILEQSDAATDCINQFGTLTDEESGLSIRTNNFPSFNHDKKILFLRGKNKTKDRKVVKIQCETEDDVQGAIDAIDRMIDAVQDLEGKEVIIEPDNRGGTGHIRMCLFGRDIAKKLSLTSKNNYPLKPIKWKISKPIYTGNAHFDEHIGQAVDVMNKSVSPDEVEQNGIINSHKVTHKQATVAVRLIKDAFQEASEEGADVAFWRLLTGIRGPDAVDGKSNKVSNMIERLKTAIQRRDWTIVQKLYTEMTNSSLDND